MRLFPKQREALTYSTKRLNILDGAVRSGKSFVSIMRFGEQVMRSEPGANFFLAGVTNASIDRNVVMIMQDLFGRHASYARSRNILSLFGRDIHIFGKGVENAMRGSEFYGGYMDEVVLVGESFFNMALSRLSTPGAQLHGATNPDNPHHWFKKKFIDRRHELDMYYQHFHIDDNIFLPSDYVAALKTEYTGIWYRRFINGEWVSGDGAIYDFFDDREPYVIDSPPCEADEYIVAVDYGIQNPSVFILMGNMFKPVLFKGHPIKCWAEDEYYYSGRDSMKQKSDYELADDFVEFVKKSRRKVKAVIVDPSATSFIVELKKRGFIVKTADNEVLDGIRVQSKLLASLEYRICSKCRETIKEYFGFTWDKRAADRGEDRPMKESDHTKDAERYGLKYIAKNRINYLNVLK